MFKSRLKIGHSTETGKHNSQKPCELYLLGPTSKIMLLFLRVTHLSQICILHTGFYMRLFFLIRFTCFARLIFLCVITPVAL
jgi:hypothetical protein